MDDPLLRNELFRRFEERTNAELRLALDEMRWWNEVVKDGLVEPDEARGHIDSAKRIVNLKLHVLGFPEFPS